MQNIIKDFLFGLGQTLLVVPDTGGRLVRRRPRRILAISRRKVASDFLTACIRLRKTFEGHRR